MNFFFVMNAKKLKQYFIILIAAIFAAGIIYSESENIAVFTNVSNEEPAAIYSIDTDKKVIALTFDISWGEKRTDPIIDILQEKNVKATFFLSSLWTRDHPEIVKDIVESGFEIGSHGHKHENYSTLSDEDIKKQIKTAHRILLEETGTTPNLIRLPNGDFDKRVLSIADELNYKVIQWDTDSNDWNNPGVDNIIERVVSKAHPGDIVLLHASDSSKQTHLALPEIIDQLRGKGYEFVTVSDLMNPSSVEKTEVKDQS
ncbi:polysaccharide deacetylase family sporulation protein PdaB [Chengkuizengella axinellae]|uniref:Polysaccharide deacetylase family sporulation protein PdaB n=1 Tax=Chengkuizengella axinellae TaxID=3064388 RepID=A0ABT9J5P0_9BACL|nr:polysaccharide deacetylase family sporulation protein PdaB [Chengkuizengella sp. 2205SS18-9]MDP5276920.1 polysaccharide deacetylase family sporulation protein PdaB [Chengkuizengella sp. 2205SS18-9]